MDKTDFAREHTESDVKDILVASLLAAVEPGKQIFFYSELLQTNLAPTLALRKRIISALTKSFTIENLKGSLSNPIVIQFNVPNSNDFLKQLIQTLKSTDLVITSHIENLILDLLAAECQKYIADQVLMYGIETKVDFPPHQKLLEILCDRPMCEVYALLWRSVKRVLDSEARVIIATTTTEAIFDRVIDKALTFHRSYREGRSKIKPFARPHNFKRSTLATVIFEYGLGYVDEYLMSSDVLDLSVTKREFRIQ